MKESLFKIPNMDCPSEENLIRLKLRGVQGIHQLAFDLEKRELKIYHQEEILPVLTTALDGLNLGSHWLESREIKQIPKEREADQRRLLWIVLAINFGFFVVESIYGYFSKSMGLIADSLDMMADALVYGLSLLAIGTQTSNQKKVALIAGILQGILALLGFLEVIRRFLGNEATPDFHTMIWVSVLALGANAYCLYLLQSSRSEEAHMKASMIFTSNDILINLGVILAGLFVLWLESGIPDLLVGAIVFVLVVLGAIRILKLSR
ncbi:cation transporter [Algoriphagus sp. CAU 1675]|uniref:cation transporter n=1 Tax=Algoriphagus sp. CAU 1675 TaxID=3032597 RepID=UPI0023DCB4E7|nr:cation transporter [Algoriphagus sp. CAU 1675]MDF2158042.1 cation transporter [Algoriphagus sp. CAU 1675]